MIALQETNMTSKLATTGQHMDSNTEQKAIPYSQLYQPPK